MQNDGVADVIRYNARNCFTHVRVNLIDYCRLDTLAMVRIVGKLRELVGEQPASR